MMFSATDQHGIEGYHNNFDHSKLTVNNKKRCGKI